MFVLFTTQMRLNKVSELIHNSTNHQNLESAGVSVHFQEIIDTVLLEHINSTYIGYIKEILNIILSAYNRMMGHMKLFPEVILLLPVLLFETTPPSII